VASLTGKQIKFGAKVTLADIDTNEETTYQIVGADEADVEKGRISITSPLSRALINKQAGDTVEVTTPRGSKAYEIMKVRFK
jgi:transcription elongation factor GreA